VRYLCRDRRLPGAGGPTDEQEQGLVEPLELVEPTEASDGLRGLLLPDDFGGQVAQPFEIQRMGAALLEITVRPPGDQGRTLGIEPGHRERPCHQTLREGRLVAERQRIQVPAFWHYTIRAISRSNSSSPRSCETETTSFAASTTSTPAPSACSATTSIAAALSSTR
jgi:hypothetical protein